MNSFKAYWIDTTGESVTHAIKETTLDMLNEGDVVIKTAYSSVNYKDSLATRYKGGVIRSYPMIPGIDASGVVVTSKSDDFKPGDSVFITGFDFGVSHTGGYSEYIRVPSEWLVKLPETVSLRDIMMIGTAGFTAALSIDAIIKCGITPESNPTILVTGATGGVGSLAIQMLKKAGYQTVHALSRKKASETENLINLGADAVLTLEDITQNSTKPLNTPVYHCIIDTVGGATASSLIPFIHYGGVMTLCGQIGGITLDTTVFPLILRGISLIGIDSVLLPMKQRTPVWNHLFNDWFPISNTYCDEISLDQLPEVFSQLQEGTHTGRTLVKF